MFTQITTELDLLVATIDKEIDYVSAIRLSEHNPNMFAEYGGRSIGLSLALSEIKKTKLAIHDHILDILKNTTDGNYETKLGILEDENRLLRDKIYLLEQDISKNKDIKKNNLNNTPIDCWRELKDDEIKKKIQDKYEEGVDYQEIIEEDNDEEE